MVRCYVVATLALSLLSAPNAGAQQRLNTQLQFCPSAQPSFDSLHLNVGRSEARAPSRWHHTKTGAVVGAVTLGVLGAVVATTQMHTGCDTGGGSGCHTGRTRAGFALYGLALGGTAGGVTGAMVGFALPVQRRTN